MRTYKRELVGNDPFHRKVRGYLAVQHGAAAMHDEIVPPHLPLAEDTLLKGLLREAEKHGLCPLPS